MDSHFKCRAEAIYQHALVLLDAEGAQALTVRRLAVGLKISTRTLYKRIGNQDKLIRKVVELHFSTLCLEFCEGDTWESTAWNWCNGLRVALCAHPHFTELMTDGDALLLSDYVDALMQAARGEGVPPDTVVECCRSLVDVTINDAIGEVRAVAPLRRILANRCGRIGV